MSIEQRREEAIALINRAIFLLESNEDELDGAEERGRCWLDVASLVMESPDDPLPPLCTNCQNSLFATEAEGKR